MMIASLKENSLGLTLVGAGQDQTIIELNHGIVDVTGQSARFRNMTIRALSGPNELMRGDAVRHFTLCNVTLSCVESPGYGLYFEPAESGSHVVTVTDCTIIGEGRPYYSGIYVPGYIGDYGPVDLYVENTSMRGFGYGVDGYFNRAGGHVYADCPKIYGYHGRVYDHDLGGYPPGIGELCK